MQTKTQMTFVFDDELSEAWSKLYEINHQPFTEFVKAAVAKENLKHSIFQISESVSSLAGSLQTSLEYKELRSQMIDERIKDYEDLC